MLTTEDTIVAIASPLVPARRGIIRMSGDGTVAVLRKVGLLQPDENASRTARMQGSIAISTSGHSLPIDLLLWPTTRSYTGQPSAELHVIGSLPLLQNLVERLTCAGARPAKPGEFTMRAFLAGRLDLTQAEAVLGVIEAEEPGMLDQALEQLAGNLSTPLQEARITLLNLLADVEAGLDFVDEDIQFIDDEVLLARTKEVAQLVRQTADQLQQRQASDASLQVILRGLPNAGKSCLLNALTQTDVAIVNASAGTTRDSITAKCELDGQLLELIDTAGIEERAADDPDHLVLAKAMQAASNAMRRADVCLWCIDASDDSPSVIENELPKLLEQEHKRSLRHCVVVTKIDVANRSPAWIDHDLPGLHLISVSSLTGEGLQELKSYLVDLAQSLDQSEIGSVVGTALRCGDALRQAGDSLDRAAELTESQLGHELVSAELRIAVENLGEVTGEVVNDDILDRVFSRFCIGK